jgi:hypothetical protein
VAETNLPQPLDAFGEGLLYPNKEYRKGERMANNLGARKGRGESSSKNRRAAKADRQEGADDRSGYRQKIREKKMTEGSKSKNGCFPKLFMLILPFIAAGTYFFLRS